jgi:ubiquitin-conjugating enzyme E2 D/E
MTTAVNKSVNKSVIKRLTNEFNDIKKAKSLPFPDEKLFGINAYPTDASDILKWTAIISNECIKDTPYEDGIFELSLEFPNLYPFRPPVVKFITPIYHCNVTTNGRISLNILADDWSPALTTTKILLGVCFLLKYPNPDEPVRVDVGKLLKRDKEKHDKLVREYTKICAKSK